MPLIRYLDKKLRPASLAIIEKANSIIADYADQGLDLTLRQVYYRFIAMDLFPADWIDPVYNRKNGLSPDTKNTEKNYKRLGELLNDARLCGEMDWDHLVDRTRELEERNRWTSPQQIIRAIADQYHIDLWENQRHRPEVWVEKDALKQIVEHAAEPRDVPFFSCRGYVSQSEMWTAGQRMRQYLDWGQTPVIIHLGDHDPSGVQMTEDIRLRLELFAEEEIEVRRIALTPDQIRLYNPPPNPAKLTDSRAEKYIREHGTNSWELDALEPQILTNLIDAELDDLTDEDLLEERKAEMERDRRHLTATNRNWAMVTAYLDANDLT